MECPPIKPHRFSQLQRHSKGLLILFVEVTKLEWNHFSVLSEQRRASKQVSVSTQNTKVPLASLQFEATVLGFSAKHAFRLFSPVLKIAVTLTKTGETLASFMIRR